MILCKIIAIASMILIPTTIMNSVEAKPKFDSTTTLGIFCNKLWDEIQADKKAGKNVTAKVELYELTCADTYGGNPLTQEAPIAGDNDVGRPLAALPSEASPNTPNTDSGIKIIDKNKALIDSLNKQSSKNPAVGSQMLIPLTNDQLSKVTVEFDWIRISNKHEGSFSGNGEFNLIVYVQGYMVELTKAFASGRNELWDVGNGEQLNFKPGTSIEIDSSKQFINTKPLYIFTLGDEVDQCQNPTLPLDIYRNDLINRGIIDYPLDSHSKWLGSIDKLRNWFNSQTDCPTLALLDRNEHLGTLTEFYEPPGYQAGPHEVRSSNGDFVLRYTVYAGADSDNDGISDYTDNCRNKANRDQRDSDRDKIGDVCDGDVDGDGIQNGKDNCVRNRNPDQSDFDDDNRGDKCDPDADGDGIADRKQRFGEPIETQ